MFGFLKRCEQTGYKKIQDNYISIIEKSRNKQLYTEFGVPDTPAARFQMILLHAVPIFRDYVKLKRNKDTQILFDMIFKDIELSFREIGVGDLGIPKKMQAYMKDFNGVMQAYLEGQEDPVQIVYRNVFGTKGNIGGNFSDYIRNLCKE